MPRFDFQCTQCGSTFEATVPFGTEKLPACTKCNGKTRKIITPPAIHFKGSGFYVTDKKARKSVEKKGGGETPEASSVQPKKPEDGSLVTKSDKTVKK